MADKTRDHSLQLVSTSMLVNVKGTIVSNSLNHMHRTDKDL